MNALTEFEGAEWITWDVPAETKPVNTLGGTTVDWIGPGESLQQTVHSVGQLTAVALELSANKKLNEPFGYDATFSISVLTSDGTPLTVRGIGDPHPQLVEVIPPAEPGTYTLVLSCHSGKVGWHRGDDEYCYFLETTPAPNPMFRTVFELSSPCETAILSASVLGCGTLFVNGHKVGEEELEPAVSNYAKTIYYRQWDIAHLLRAGPNEILIFTGRERFVARGGDIWKWHLAPWNENREPMALAALTMTDKPGTTQRLVTDTNWLVAPSCLDREIFFAGETWRLSSDEPAWQPAKIASGTMGELRLATHPPVIALDGEPPASVTHISSHCWVYDFGRLMTGRTQLDITGEPGSVVKIRSGEQLSKDGNVLCENPLIIGEAQLDQVHLDRQVDNYQWTQGFGYRGFRWVQIQTEGDVAVKHVRAIPLHTKLRTVGRLQTSDPLLNWINTATARTFENNQHGIPTDTPIYEKNGWTADAHLATEALLHHFDLRQAFMKWMDDHVDSQREDGAIPQIVPSPNWETDTDPAWAASTVLIPWDLYQEYGDISILNRYAPMIKRFADNLYSELEDGMWTGRTCGDWLPPGCYATGKEGAAPIGTIMSAHVLTTTASVLRELGDADAVGYLQWAKEVSATYHRAYFDSVKGCYRVPGLEYRQSMNVLPLAFGTVPEACIESVRKSLIDDIEKRTQGHLDTGAIATRWLLPVLSDAGREDLALTVLLQRNRPGWGVWYEDGERTLLESWDKDARSRNHYFLGAASSWIQQHAGGMRPTAPGWSHFEINPVHDERVTHAQISHITPFGEAKVYWKRGPGGWTFEITVPTGSQATLRCANTERTLDPGKHRIRIEA